MKDFYKICVDAYNTTRLRFKTFWHGLMCKIEERKRQEEEHLKKFTQSCIDYLFK